MLTQAQLEQARQDFWRWRGTLAPCGISHVDIYNPCLPQQESGRLLCLTCGLFQRLELAPGRNP